MKIVRKFLLFLFQYKNTKYIKKILLAHNSFGLKNKNLIKKIINLFFKQQFSIIDENYISRFKYYRNFYNIIENIAYMYRLSIEKNINLLIEEYIERKKKEPLLYFGITKRKRQKLIHCSHNYTDNNLKYMKYCLNKIYEKNKKNHIIHIKLIKNTLKKTKTKINLTNKMIKKILNYLYI